MLLSLKPWNSGGEQERVTHSGAPELWPVGGVFAAPTLPWSAYESTPSQRKKKRMEDETVHCDRTPQPQVAILLLLSFCTTNRKLQRSYVTYSTYNEVQIWSSVSLQVNIFFYLTSKVWKIMTMGKTRQNLHWHS